VAPTPTALKVAVIVFPVVRLEVRTRTEVSVTVGGPDHEPKGGVQEVPYVTSSTLPTRMHRGTGSILTVALTETVPVLQSDGLGNVVGAG
jgi:hypothetical protein